MTQNAVQEAPRKDQPSPGDVAAIGHLRDLYKQLRAEIAKVIIGQEEVIEQLLIGVDFVL